MRQKIIAFIRSTNLEAVIWIFGLLYLAFYSPANDNHFTFCPIKGLGFSFCPGCGLGESISHLFRFEISESFHCHPFGIFALPILVNRIIYLVEKSYRNYQKNSSQPLGVNNNG